MLEFFTFSRQDAIQYGVDEAIMLHHIRYWVAKNEANDRNYCDGKYWTYNTQKALAQLFPFWSARKVGRILQKLEEQSAIMSGNYNDKKYDRTKWFTLTDASATIEHLDMSNLTNGKAKTVEPIPKNNQSTKHCTNIVMPFDSEDFKNWWDIWKEYRKKQHKFYYNSNHTEQARLKQLAEISQNDEQKAIQHIEEAIAGGWRKFYPLRKKSGTDKNFDLEKYSAYLDTLEDHSG